MPRWPPCFSPIPRPARYWPGGFAWTVLRSTGRFRGVYHVRNTWAPASSVGFARQGSAFAPSGVDTMPRGFGGGYGSGAYRQVRSESVRHRPGGLTSKLWG